MTVLKVTYDVLGLFSLKQYEMGHLSNESYPVPMKSTIRGAILAQMIQQEGRAYAESHFKELLELPIFIQQPEHFAHSQVLLNRITNKGVAAQGTISAPEDVDMYRTVGIRGMVHVTQVVFYIEDKMEGLERYLKSIPVLGDSESLVGLRSIEVVRTLTNVLLPFSPDLGFGFTLQEVWDWPMKKKFSQAYGYSTNRSGANERTLCYVRDEIDASEVLRNTY